MKNKHLVLAVLFAVLTMGAIQHYGGDYLWNQAETARSAGDHVKALAYYDALIERYPQHSRRPDALYWSAELLPSFENFAATFFPDGSRVVHKGLSKQDLPEGSLTRIQRYLMILEEYPTHWTAHHVHFQLADAYHTLGDPRAEELYLKTLHNEMASRRVDAGLRLMQIYESQGHLEEALKIIRYCQNELSATMSIDTQIKLGDILAALGDPAGAMEAYQEALLKASEIKETFPPGATEEERALFSVKAEYARRIEPRLESLEQPDSSVYVQGQVSLLGSPLAGVNVYVRPAADGSKGFSMALEGPGQWVTDQSGRFAGHLAPGSYEFGISLNFHQAELVEGTHLQIVGGRQELRPGVDPEEIIFRFVDTVELKAPTSDFVYAGGPIEIAWEPYPGAEKYQVWFGAVSIDESTGTRHASFPVGVTSATEFTVAVRHVLPFGSVGVDPLGVEPGCLVLRPEAFDRLRVRVDALDGADQVLSSSTGLNFGGDREVPGEIKVQEGLRTKAEELLFQRKYDQAVELLEDTLEENPEDIDALWLLARIHQAGTYSLEEKNWDHRDFAHYDLEKSLALLERIQELQPGPEVEEALRTVRSLLPR